MRERILNTYVAESIVTKIRGDAKSDGGDPVAITVIGFNGQRILTKTIDKVMPISVDLSFKKAYTALMTNTDTVEWEKRGTDPSNFVDPNITCFGGGVLLKLGSVIFGAVGVSGRKSRRDDDKDPPQDHELARIGADFFEAEAKLKKQEIEKAIKEGKDLLELF